MPTKKSKFQHAALWLIGPDMPGLLRLGAEYVAQRGGNIDRNIADCFGDRALVFMSITAKPIDIARMDLDRKSLVRDTGCGVVFQPTNQPTVPTGYAEDLYGFDLLTDDTPGLIVDLTELVGRFGILLVGHSGERRVIPGLAPLVQAGQKFVVMLPHAFDRVGFTTALNEFVKKHNGVLITSLRPVPGLLWSW